MSVRVVGTGMTAFCQAEKRDQSCHENNKEEVMKLRGSDGGQEKHGRLWREKAESRKSINTVLMHQILTK